MTYVYSGEFTVKLEKEFIDESDDGQPEDYYYLHITNPFSTDVIGWVTLDDAKELLRNLTKAVKKQEQLNKKLGWKNG